VDYIENVCDMLSNNPQVNLITIDDVCTMDSVLEKFYGVEHIRSYEKLSPKNMVPENDSVEQVHRNDKIAVYTCITGGYDIIKEPCCVEENCDYYLISDEKPKELNVYKWIDVKDVVPANIMDNAAKNRWCKMHGHKIFENYKYSIYMDGSIQIVKPISYYKENIGRVGIAMHKHPLRDCIFEEGLRIYANRRGNLSKEAVVQQMKKYLFSGMPRNYGLFACTMIVRDHSDAIGNAIMTQWFEEYMNSLRRDQLSFTYILWKNGIVCSDVGILNNGVNIRKNKDFIINDKHGMR
jgi:hypothetical protein